MGEGEHDACPLSIAVQQLGSAAQPLSGGPGARPCCPLGGGDGAGEPLLLPTKTVQRSGASACADRETEVRDRRHYGDERRDALCGGEE